MGRTGIWSLQIQKPTHRKTTKPSRRGGGRPVLTSPHYDMEPKGPFSISGFPDPQKADASFLDATRVKPGAAFIGSFDCLVWLCIDGFDSLV